jgi:hypothetical protein
MAAWCLPFLRRWRQRGEVAWRGNLNYLIIWRLSINRVRIRWWRQSNCRCIFDFSDSAGTLKFLFSDHMDSGMSLSLNKECIKMSTYKADRIIKIFFISYLYLYYIPAYSDLYLCNSFVITKTWIKKNGHLMPTVLIWFSWLDLSFYQMLSIIIF